MFVAGGAVLIVLIGRMVWRSMHKGSTTVSPVSEQWLAERRGKRTSE